MQITLTKKYIIEGIELNKGCILQVQNADMLGEMARSLKDIKQDLCNTRVLRIEHLFKLFYYRGQPFYYQNREGWLASARKGLINIGRDKKTNKYPKADELFEAVWTEYEDSFEDLHDTLIDDLNREGKMKYFTPITEICYKEIFNFCKEYSYWFCDRLSQKGSVSMNEVEEEIETLLIEYCPF